MRFAVSAVPRSCSFFLDSEGHRVTVFDQFETAARSGSGPYPAGRRAHDPETSRLRTEAEAYGARSAAYYGLSNPFPDAPCGMCGMKSLRPALMGTLSVQRPACSISSTGASTRRRCARLLPIEPRITAAKSKRYFTSSVDFPGRRTPAVHLLARRARAYGRCWPHRAPGTCPWRPLGRRYLPRRPAFPLEDRPLVRTQLRRSV